MVDKIIATEGLLNHCNSEAPQPLQLRDSSIFVSFGISLVFYNTILFTPRPWDCYGVALHDLERPVNHPGAGIGKVFVLLGRRILDGKPGVQGEASSPFSIFHRAIST